MEEEEEKEEEKEQEQEQEEMVVVVAAIVIVEAAALAAAPVQSSRRCSIFVSLPCLLGPLPLSSIPSPSVFHASFLAHLPSICSSSNLFHPRPMLSSKLLCACVCV